MTAPDSTSTMATQRPVIAIVGPTASGKTPLSLALAQRWGGSAIVSADSRVIYCGLDIGTAKPTMDEQALVPHFMIDILDPTSAYSVAQYAEVAHKVLRGRDASDDVAPTLVVGGTGFYLRALLQDSFIPNMPVNMALRSLLQAEANSLGHKAFHNALAALDPARAACLHPNDTVRIVRAREVIAQTGQPVQNNSQTLNRPVLWIGLGVEDRAWLHHRIAKRVHAMLANGWLAEVESLIAQYGPEAHALHITHGYPELCQVLSGKLNLTDATDDIIIQVRQYARRQLTWFRRNTAIQWINVDTMSLDKQVEHVTHLWLNFNHG
jgi:tRNA dimethylallyltransferase